MVIINSYVEVVDMVDEVDIYPPDTGCEYSDSCLTCPITDGCKDDPWVRKRLARQKRRRQRQQARNLEQEGKSVQEIAEIMGVSVRTVQRRLSK